jgi:hypothetical protein
MDIPAGTARHIIKTSAKNRRMNPPRPARVTAKRSISKALEVLSENNLAGSARLTRKGAVALSAGLWPDVRKRPTGWKKSKRLQGQSVSGLTRFWRVEHL